MRGHIGKLLQITVGAGQFFLSLAVVLARNFFSRSARRTDSGKRGR
jgi:hypothetical protein